MQRRVIILEDEEGNAETFTSVTGMIERYPEMSIKTLREKGFPCHYKGYYLRRVPLNRRWPPSP